MKEFHVEGVPARIGAGTKVGLTAEQYSLRRHNIEAATAGEGGLMIGTAKVPLEFKVGETILIEGEEPRAPVNPLTGEAISKPARKRVAAAKAKAAAKKPAKK